MKNMDQMNGAPEKIKDVLERQIEEYKDLLVLLRKERQCLIDFDGSGVKDLAKQKDTAVLKLRLLEQERLRLMGDFQNLSGEKDRMSLQDLSKTTGDGAFLEIRNRMISLLQGIQELNEFNRILIERSLNFFNGSLDFLGKAAPQKQVAGHAAGGNWAQGMMISRHI